MFDKFDTLWIDTNPSFLRFEAGLIRKLYYERPIAQWKYYQHQDEGSCLNIALTLLHDYLKSCPKKINLIGHSTGGLLGLLYARKYPNRVKSLTLLGVGVYPAIDWQVHYYALRQFLPCSREIILSQMVQRLFGDGGKQNTKKIIEILERDLKTSPSPHSLYKQISIPPGGVEIPLMICGSKDDPIVDRNALYGWKNWLKEGDRFWECDGGHHFFHYFYPEKVSREITKFWQSLDENQSSGEISVNNPILKSEKF